MFQLTYHLSEIEEVAKKIIPLLKHKIVLLKGDMGKGKTTLAKALIKTLNINETISSPTFSIVNEYVSENTKVFHFDFYRIKSIEEALDFGVEEYIYSDAWCFMEWSEKIAPLLPDQVSVITITAVDEHTRTIFVE